MGTEQKSLAAIRDAMLTKIKDSSITPKEVSKFKFQPMVAQDAAKLGFPEAGGFKIPYFDKDGKVTKFYRFRYMEEPKRTGFAAQTVPSKQLRYTQPANTTPLVYFPPGIHNWNDVITNTDVALVITEGELKSIAGCKAGMPVIGLGGVWNFRAIKKKTDLLPDLQQFKWKDRKVYIAYDSDSASNPMVMMAERVLAEKLLSLGADVYIVRIPAKKNESKVGLDDYINKYGQARALKLFSNHAYRFELSAALHELNSEVIYVRDPGIIVENESFLKMTPSNFTSHAYANRFFTEYNTLKDGSVQAKKRPTAQAWIQWEYRAELNRMTYAPGQPRIIARTRELNIWKGWGVESRKGDVKPWKELLDHIFGDDHDARKWFEQWCAYPIQNPGAKLLTSPVIWGLVEGSGKSLIGYTLMKIYGENSVEIHDTQLRDDRNEWAEGKQFVLADDITGHNNRELANRLKTLITQKTIRLNPKYIPSYSIPDCINYYFTSNDVDAFFLTDQDRRYFIHEVRAGKLDQVWLEKYLKWWEDGGDGIPALRHYFDTLDLSGFNPASEAFRTESKKQMVSLTRSDLGDWVHELGKDGPLIINGLSQKGDLWTSHELLRLFDPDHRTGVKHVGMARELTKQGYRQLKQIRTQFGVVRLFVLRNEAQWMEWNRKKNMKKVIEHYEETCPEFKRAESAEKAQERRRKF